MIEKISTLLHFEHNDEFPDEKEQMLAQWPFCHPAPPKTPEIPLSSTASYYVRACFTYFCLFSEVTVAVVDPFGEKHEFFMRLSYWMIDANLKSDVYIHVCGTKKS